MTRPDTTQSTDGFRIAVDIGGTFTDGMLEHSNSGAIWLAKSLTTPNDPGEAVSTVMASLMRSLAAASPGDAPAARGENVRELVHATTRVANALIERDGAKVGLLLTTGTKDVLDIRREFRYDLYDLDLVYPEPLASPGRRIEIDERIDTDGNIITAIDRDDLKAAIAKFKKQKIEAVAVCFLNACVNDAHEKAAGDLIRDQWPDVSLCLSSELAREIKEFERMSTTVANAFVQPLMSDYLNGLQGRMAEAAIAGPLRIMVSSGGFTSSSAAAQSPIALLESGPAGGVLSAAYSATAVGIDNLLAFDMGGTTAKACVVMKGQPEIAHDFEAGRVRRFKKNSGHPILLPSIDLIEIGAGGGSIAHKSTLGLLNVGPRSAGADPGPACYNIGGRDATVTDADLMLGYLDANDFLGGEMILRPDLAEAAIKRLATDLNTPSDDVTFGIFDLVNENMATAARVHIAEKGIDPRHLTLVATGGAGPVHAVEVAYKTGIRKVLCGIGAGAGSCLGLLVAPLRVERAISRKTLLTGVDWTPVNEMLATLQTDAVKEATDADGNATLVWRLSLDMRYAGQGDTIAVQLPFSKLSAESLPEIEAAYDARYRELYGQTIPGGEMEIVTWRLIGQSDQGRKSFRMAATTRAKDAAPSQSPSRGTRRLFRTDTRTWAEVPVLDRYACDIGSVMAGPLVLRERESTVLVPRAATVTVLDNHAILIDLNSDRSAAEAS